jgi:hypothetical protein
MGNKFILGQEDGTVAGGNARGNGAVDLQMSRSAATQVASGEYSFIGSGQNNINLAPVSVIVGGVNNYINGSVGSTYQNKVIVGGDSNQISNVTTRNTFVGGGYGNNINGASEGGLIVGGYQNTLSASQTVISGGQSNSVSSNFSTISGGQSNVASTNTHATVVGGQSNVSSGQHSVTGGQINTASNIRSVAFGEGNIASGEQSVSLGAYNNTSSTRAFSAGGNNTNSGDRGVALGNSNTVSGNNSVAVGNGNQALGNSSFASGVGSYSRKTGSVSMGSGSNSYLKGQFSFSTGGSDGNSIIRQSNILIPFRVAALTTGGTTKLSLDGTGVTELITSYTLNAAYGVTSCIIAVVKSISGTATGVNIGDTFIQNLTFAFKGSNTVPSSILGSVNTISTHTDLSMSTSSVSYSVPSANELQINFNAPTFLGGGSVTFEIINELKITMMQGVW